MPYHGLISPHILDIRYVRLITSPNRVRCLPSCLPFEVRIMAKRLTVTVIMQAKPKAESYEIPTRMSRLRLLVGPSGAKSFLTRFRSPVERDRKGNGKARKLILPGDGRRAEDRATAGRKAGRQISAVGQCRRGRLCGVPRQACAQAQRHADPRE
jgi:hypothetical protein